MPTSKYFDNCPEFPSDVLVADIPVISFEKLKEQDIDESLMLFQACREHGFFLLDFRNSAQGQALLNSAEAMFDLTNEILDMDNEVLKEYRCNPPKNLDGYKAAGMLKGEGGTHDAIEVFTIGRDDILGKHVPPQPRPLVVETRAAECQQFVLYAHEVTCMIMDCLNNELELPAGQLKSLCSIDKPSATSFRMLRNYPAALSKGQEVTFPGHTDTGTITLLFNVVGGLQILPSNVDNIDENWRYVRPQQGCAIVNLGDSLVQLTGGVLRSNLHRVRNPPGEQARMTRQSLAYLVRPPRSSSMRRLTGSSIIPPLREGEKDETLSVDDWAAQRSLDIMNGRLKVQSFGGLTFPSDQRVRMPV